MQHQIDAASATDAAPTVAMQHQLQMQNELKRFSYQLQKCSTCYRNSALARDAAPAAALAGKTQHLHVNRELVPFYKIENCYTGYSNGFLRRGQFGALTGKSKDHQKRHETPFNILVESAPHPLGEMAILGT